MTSTVPYAMQSNSLDGSPNVKIYFLYKVGKQTRFVQLRKSTFAFQKMNANRILQATSLRWWSNLNISWGRKIS